MSHVMSCDYHHYTGVEVKVGSEVMCCVIGVEGEMVRVSLNPALIEGRKEERRKKKRNSGGRQQMVGKIYTNIDDTVHIPLSHSH